MKYGDTLALRSVQEWLPYNVDYTEIKNLIKQYTTKRPPVASPDQHTEFEDELFEVFMDQLGRIDLFVKSKAGEIDRRIASCERQITALRNNRTRRRAQIANRYAKIEQEVARVGHDVQSLSRFVNVQRTAFLKLLKKYRKWTGSACLPDRVLILLESPTAFHRLNFDRNVIEVSELLTAVRDGINSLSDETFATPQFQNLHNGRPAAAACATNVTPHHDYARSRLDLDVAFATSRVTRGSRAVFWVHNEHVIELQVFLLKHLNLQTSSPTASVAATPLASRRSSDASLAVRGESVGCVILDDLKGFASVQNTATIDQATKSAMRTAGRIQWCSRDSEAVVIVSDQSGTILEDTTSTELLEVKMRKKQVESLLDPAAGVPSLREVESMQQRRDMEKIRDWLKSHSGVTPLAKILSNRTRFFGPVAGGQAWAFVDRDIKMISHSDHPGWVTSESEGGPEGAKMIEFPHAVVEIQWDGKQTPAFIHELMQSHFVESVPGFSIDAHAIAVLYEPKDMLPPVWLAALEKDIRKTPSQRPTISRRNSSRIVFSTASSKNSSIFTGDSASHTTPVTSDFGGMASSRKKRKRRSPREIKPIANARYWNEFDDDEDNEEEPYTILVRPSSANSYDEVTEQSLGAYMLSPIMKLLSRIRGKEGKEQERHPLLGESPGPDTDSDGDHDYSYRTFGGRSTTTTTNTTATSRRTTAYDASHIWLLALSLLMLLVSGALAVGESLSGHKRGHKHIGKLLVVDLSVLVGVLVCLASGVLGLMVFLVKSARVGWCHKVAVWSTFAAVCVGCGVVVAMTSRDIVGEA